MGKRRSIIKEVCDRIETLTELGVSRHKEKREMGLAWGERSGKIHSIGTKRTYKRQAIQFVRWARTAYGVTHLDQIDNIDDLVCEYLWQGIQQDRSAWTLKTQRAALRMVFQDRDLGDAVPLPARAKAAIKRSRSHTADNLKDHFGPRWVDLYNFSTSVGLRRHEMLALRSDQIVQRADGVYLEDVKGKGGKMRDVPVLPARESLVLTYAGRGDTRIFPTIPKRIDVHAARRVFSQSMYTTMTGGELPTKEEISRGHYDRQAALQVSRALGHNRVDVVIQHYLV